MDKYIRIGRDNDGTDVWQAGEITPTAEYPARNMSDDCLFTFEDGTSAVVPIRRVYDIAHINWSKSRSIH